MPTFNKFQSFVAAVHEKKHNLATDTLKILLTNTAPVNTNTVKADLTEISAGFGYTAGGLTSAQVSSGQIGGVYKLVLTDVTLLASGGSIGPFRYAVLYNDTATNDELIGWWDRGSSLTLSDTQSVILDVDGTNGIFQTT